MSKRPYAMILEPGFKAFETGVRHAHMAYTYLGQPPPTPPHSPAHKKIKSDMAPIRNANKKGTTTRGSAYKKGKSVTNKVKKTILSMATTYHSTTADNISGVVGILNNNIYSLNLTALVDQGATDTDRQGDSIYIAALKMRGMLTAAQTANGYTFRVMVGWSGEEFTLVNLAITGLTATNIFLPTAGPNVILGSIVNPKAFNCIYDYTVDVNSEVSGANTNSSMSTTIPINQKFSYQSSGSALGKTKNLYLVVIPYTPGGTLSTSCGNALLNTDLIFKNL